MGWCNGKSQETGIERISITPSLVSTLLKDFFGK
jgi:hypothetical protein